MVLTSPRTVANPMRPSAASCTSLPGDRSLRCDAAGPWVDRDRRNSEAVRDGIVLDWFRHRLAGERRRCKQNVDVDDLNWLSPVTRRQLGPHRADAHQVGPTAQVGDEV